MLYGRRKEELPITIGLLVDIEGYEVYFETNFTGAGGKFQILQEILEIKNYVKIKKEGEWLKIEHDSKFLNSMINKLKIHESSYGVKTSLKKVTKLVKESKSWIGLDQRVLEYNSWALPRSSEEIIEGISYSRAIVSKISFQTNEKLKEIIILSPKIKYKIDFNDRFIRSISKHNDPLYEVATEKIHSIIKDILILYPLNVRFMKVPQPFKREEIPKEDGSNIASVFHTIYLKEGKIPEEIYNPFSMVFPKIDLRPHITDDGRVMIKFYEEGFELLPPNTSDGIYKILTVLIAIYLKPPLLIIDEIENSLHPETLELILNTIKIGDTQAIITTHSPVVVDMTDLSNIILVEKEQGESKFKRIKDPDKIREFLIEKSITFSEGWIYGDLLKTEKQA